MTTTAGILVITHCLLGKELINAAELILGKINNISYVSIMETAVNEDILKTIEEKISFFRSKGDNVLILTDMFGGTPTNLSLSFLDKDIVEVVTGVNLPMLIAVVSVRDQMGLSELGKIAQEEGRRSVKMAGKLIE